MALSDVVIPATTTVLPVGSPRISPLLAVEGETAAFRLRRVVLT